MAAKIGILAESTATSQNTTVTVYTVPADKAARIRIIFAAEGGAGNWSYELYVGTPGTERTFSHYTTGSGYDLWSGVLEESSPNPALSKLARVAGVQEVSAGLGAGLDDEGAVADFWVTPMPFDYFLSTGDTVRFRITTTALADGLIQVIGVEDDA